MVARRFVFKALVGTAGVLVLVQAISIARPASIQKSHPSITVTEKLPSGVKGVVDRACMDCHSNETRWPWYSRLFPVSWMIQRDVRRGRSHLDFSMFVSTNSSPTANQAEEMCDEVSKGAMPPKPYRMMHHEAQLSKDDVAQVCNWADSLNRQASNSQ